MKLIVGLGNPGPDYVLTRHNIGFLAVDGFAEIHAAGSSWRSEHKALTVKVRCKSEQVLLVKPQTFMNLSGQSIVSLMNFYQIDRSDLLVVHDEADQKFGLMKFVKSRGHAGHNGIRNVHELLGSDEYARLRLGVGRPPNFVDDEGNVTRSTMSVADFVLKNFSKDEQKSLPDFIEKSCQAMEAFVFEGLDRAANLFNQKG